MMACGDQSFRHSKAPWDQSKTTQPLILSLETDSQELQKHTYRTKQPLKKYNLSLIIVSIFITPKCN